MERQIGISWTDMILASRWPMRKQNVKSHIWWLCTMFLFHTIHLFIKAYKISPQVRGFIHWGEGLVTVFYMLSLYYCPICSWKLLILPTNMTLSVVLWNISSFLRCHKYTKMVSEQHQFIHFPCPPYSGVSSFLMIRGWSTREVDILPSHMIQVHQFFCTNRHVRPPLLVS